MEGCANGRTEAYTDGEKEWRTDIQRVKTEGMKGGRTEGEAGRSKG